MSSHLHLVLRSRPDVVAVRDDTYVARRWLMLCPLQRDEHGQPVEPTEFNLNPIREAPSETIEGGDFTSAQKRARNIQAEHATSSGSEVETVTTAGQSSVGCSGHLAPLDLQEGSGQTGPCVQAQGTRCSDKGSLAVSTADYFSLPDWTARQSQSGKSRSTPQRLAPLFERLGVNAEFAFNAVDHRATDETHSFRCEAVAAAGLGFLRGAHGELNR